MAGRSNFVPVLNRKGISKRQKKFILDEHEAEVNFRMEPASATSLYGWFDGQTKDMKDLGNGFLVFRCFCFFFFFFFFLFLGGQIGELWEVAEKASKQLQAPREPYVDTVAPKSHLNETNLAALVAKTRYIIEQHAVAVSVDLKRHPNQDLGSYVKELQMKLQLERRTCEKYVNMYNRACWTGPVRSAFTIAEWVQLHLYFRQMIDQIDRAVL